jgi:hypothetical protein
MHKLSYFHLSAAILAFSLGADARGTELERRTPIPASFGRRGCPTATNG